MNFIYLNLLKTFIAIFVVIVVDVAIEVVFIRRLSNKKKKKKYKVLTRNILVVSLLIFLAKIWIEGFGHLLAFVGFISAALTITQKENVLNLSGALIIMWRDAFSEGDYIAIKEYEGIVKNIGIFYFTLEETTAGNVTPKSGRTIKVPNSYVSLYPFCVYSFDSFVFFERQYVFTYGSNISKLKQFASDIQSSLTKHVESSAQGFTADETKEYKKLVSKGGFLKFSTDMTIYQEEPWGLCLKISGHCPLREKAQIGKKIEEEILLLTQNPDIDLAG